MTQLWIQWRRFVVVGLLANGLGGVGAIAAQASEGIALQASVETIQLHHISQLEDTVTHDDLLAPQQSLGLLSQAQTALREQRYPEAEVLWRELVRQWPDSAEMSYSFGITLHRQFKIKAAAQAYVTAAVLNPNHREAHINLSLARIQLGLVEEALEPLEHVLSLPDRPSKPASIHAMAYYNRAIVLGRQGKLEESRQAVDAALAIEPDFREAKELIDLIR